MNDDECDVVIIGAGAAGLAAGIVLARTGVAVVIIHDGRPRNAPAQAMHGYVSRDGVAPAEFLAVGRDEVAGYGARFVEDRVVEATRQEDGRFALVLAGGAAVRPRAIVVATGLTDELPDIPGVQGFWGSSVHHCPHCHGYEVRDRELVVIGGAMPHVTLHHSALLRRYSDRVTLCRNGMELPDGERVRLQAFGTRVVDGTVTGLVDDQGTLTGVALDSGEVLPAEAVFIAPRPRPNDEVLRALGCEQDPATGLVITDATGATSVRGVWAAGNVINPRAQVITAAGEASAAAIAVTGWLLERDVTTAATGLQETGR